jgi:hypothetical protein
MFISEEEARNRLSSTNNLLKRLGINTTEPHEVEILKDEVDIALDEVKKNPTIPSEDDAVRLAVLAGRRHLTTSSERGGRYPQQGNIPPIFRSLIGSAARLGTNKGTAKAFGVSQVTVNNLKHGRLSAEGEVNPSLLSKIERDTLAVRDQVLGVLAFTVAGITQESIEGKDPKELSIIARNLSSIMASTKPTEVLDKTTNAQVIVFSPEQGGQDYETVEIG